MFFKSPPSFSRTENFYIVVICNNQIFISQILRVIDPLGEKFDFFSPLGPHIQRDSGGGCMRSRKIWKIWMEMSGEREEVAQDRNKSGKLII